MKHDREDPCRQCPFRTKAAAGWLGSYTPDTILQHIFDETPFPCHITVDYESDDWRETIFAADTKVQACSGFLIMMRKFAKLPRDYETGQHAMRLNKDHPAVFRLWADFVEHHHRK
jgi:hypothetical protein